MPGIYTEGTDTGYIFSGPHIQEKTKTVKKDVILVDNHREGVIFNENPDSPWSHATFYSHGSILEDSEGKFIQEVALCETTDPDGDLTWSILWRPSKGPIVFHFVMGTGKWEGITGEGTTLGMLRGRTDDHYMLRSEIHWKIDN